MQIKMTEPAEIDATVIKEGEYDLHFYRGRKYVHGHTIKTLDKRGEVLDTAMVKVDETGKISLIKLQAAVVPKADKEVSGHGGS